MSTIEIRPDHGFVVGALIGGYLVHNLWMSIKVGSARKKYGVTYPALYADESKPDGKAFNCVQRGHQNSLENLPSFYMLTVIAGARFPLAAALCATIYTAGRISYFNGYATGDPKGRMRGGYMYFGSLGLLGMAVRTAVELIRAKFA